ncbi:MAG: hypothetical protein KF774_17550 [Planctomyces sp.]|nr:hypothetical protein [Planctomyces sp.]
MAGSRYSFPDALLRMLDVSECAARRLDANGDRRGDQPPTPAQDEDCSGN